MRAVIIGLTGLACSTAFGVAWASTTETTLYGCLTRGTSATTCAEPAGDLVRDPAGNLYGVSPTGESSSGQPTCQGTPICIGNAFELVPPTAGQTQYTINILHVFTNVSTDGNSPKAGMIIDASGNLYGTTPFGGSYEYGTAFELSPPVAGTTVWTETILHNFTSPDGVYPSGSLLAGPDGVLYGVTEQYGALGGGTVYRLQPQQSAGAPRALDVLYTFNSNGTGLASPGGRLIADASGALYGVAESGGIANAGGVYRLLPPANGSTKWTEQTLHIFTGAPDGAVPEAGLAMDARGNLFGTTSSGGNASGSQGAVYELSPPTGGATTWTETILHSFKAATEGGTPVCDLLVDDLGNLVGTTSIGPRPYYGSVFALLPPRGKGGWILNQFFFDGTDGEYPLSGLIAGAPDTLVGTVSDGLNLAGAIYSIAR
jgi:hypothetical protein